MSYTKIIILFKLLCIVSTVVMILYWIAVFWKNEDISRIEIQMFENLEDIEPPELTMCFLHPFLVDRLKDHIFNFSVTNYLKYLKGEIPDNGIYSDINFENVTLNFVEYVVNVHIRFRGGNWALCNNIRDCPYLKVRNSMNAFWDEGMIFIKCFGIQIEASFKTQVNGMYFIFRSNFTSLLDKGLEVFVNFNYPYQTLLMDEGDAIWENGNKIAWVKLKTVDVLRRRNTINNPCISMEESFDEWISKRHIEKVGCSAPYHLGSEEVPMCKTVTKMRESIFNKVKKSKQHTTPCLILASITYKTNVLSKTTFNSSSYKTSSSLNLKDKVALMVSYPDKMKVITQSQAVDFQALIGYIGGYIGLILGIIHYEYTMNFYG